MVLQNTGKYRAEKSGKTSKEAEGARYLDALAYTRRLLVHFYVITVKKKM